MFTVDVVSVGRFPIAWLMFQKRNICAIYLTTFLALHSGQCAFLFCFVMPADPILIILIPFSVVHTLFHPAALKGFSMPAW